MSRKSLFLKLNWVLYTLLVLAITLSALEYRTGTARANALASCPWQQAPSPQATGAHSDQLQSISASSASNAWAVGSHADNNFTLTTYQPLAEHWNGTVWSVVPSLVSGASAQFNAVATVSDDDAWAVGIEEPGSPSPIAIDGGQGLIEHWNGKQWQSVPIPAQANSTLTSITAVAPNDIWAGGYFWVGINGISIPETFSLILHWDGQFWHVISNTIQGQIMSMKAFSPNDVWAIGEAGQNGRLSSMALHWDGGTWNTLATAQIPNATSSALTAVSGSAGNDVWLLGSYIDTGRNFFPLLEHWDGSTWQLVTVPAFSAPANGLLANAVDALSATDVWIVGSLSSTSQVGGVPVSVALMLHWNGQSWERVPGARLRAESSSLLAITHAPESTRVWGVGDALSGTTVTQSGLILTSSDDC